MKKLLCFVISSVGLSAWALPSYEPFNEYSNLVAAGSSIDLATSGFYVTNGSVVEQWGGGDSGFGLFFSQGTPTATAYQDVSVTNTTSTVFTQANLASLLPSGFPGAGADIDITAYLPHNTGANTAGDSAVLKFAQDIPRPTSGVTTIYVSYLLDVTGNPSGASGANAGRYAGFLSQSNLYEGAGTGGAYTTWTSLFNTFGGNPTYVAYGEATNKPAVAGGQGDNIVPADSSVAAGGSGCAGTKAFYNTPNFVVGCFTFTTGGGVADTNTVWLNPPLADFGGPTPSANNVSSYTMGTVMSDVDGFFLESRSGGATGGIGPTFIGNLLIGHTWSYVTGGPEFTNVPQSIYIFAYGTNLTLSGGAVAAAQNVSYQWQKIVGGATNNLSDGAGTAGGTAIVSGSRNQTLMLTNVSAGDMGQYQLVATASGTGFSLATSVSIIYANAGPPIFTSNPSDATANYGGTASFTASASATLPSMSYQWYFGSIPLTNGVQADGSTVSGAAGTISADTLSATLILSNVTYLENGDYSLIVTNSFGSVTSAVASLTVSGQPVVVAQFPITYTNLNNTNFMTVYAGASPTFTVSAIGAPPLYYYWFTNGVVDGNATNASLSLTNAQSSFMDYCIVTNISGAVTSVVWDVSVIADPANSSGGLASYPQSVLADDPIGYWRLNEGPDNNNGDDGYLAYDYAGGNDGIYTNVILGNTGYNPTEDPSDTSAEFGEYPYASLPIVDEYAGQIQGIDFATPSGSNAEFTVEAWVNGFSGASSQVFGAAVATRGVYGVNDEFNLGIDSTKVHYRFYVRAANGTQYTVGSGSMPPLDGNWHHLVGVCDEANGLLSLYFDGQLVNTEAIPTNAGVYEASEPMTIGAGTPDGVNYTYQFNGFINDVAVYNYALSASQVAAQYVSTGVPPILIQPPPAAVATNGGGSLMIPVAVIGTGPLNYVWSDVSGGTNIVTGSANGNILNATLAVASVPAGWNNDQLELTVSDDYGTTNVFVALTIVTNSPQITLNLPSQVTIVSGKSYTYAISADGMLPLSYQWFSAGTLLLGQTNASLTVTAGNDGSGTTYWVVITNVFGSATSTVSTFTLSQSLTGSTGSYETNLLPTYEPFNEYSNLVAAGSSIDLATSGFYVTNGSVVEQWGGGDSGFGLFFSQGTPTATAYQDVSVTNTTSTVFTQANLASLLPSGFPGAGADIDITAYLPHNTGANTAGDSAVLKFAQDIPRPTSGVTTIYVSYLLDVTGNPSGASGANAGRYAGFLSQSNLYEGAGTGGAYTTWTSLFNTFGGNPTYVAYGEATNKPAVAGGQGDNIVPADSSVAAGGSGCAGTKAFYNTPNFVVGCFTFTTGGGVADTNTVWLNPPLADFGGPTPSANNVSSYTMGTVMSDVDGFFLESRSGGATGGIGPTFIGNLLIGHTWSYVTGGPEFTLQPETVVIGSDENASLTGTAVAAGQAITYQWIHIVDGLTNILTDGVGTAGGGATVSGSTNGTLSLTNLTSADMDGTYELVAQAGGTGFTLASQPATITAAVNTNPTNIVFSVSSVSGANQLTLSWPADHIGWQLQVQTNNLSVGINTNWVNVAGSTTNDQITVPINTANGAVFYRLVYPPQ